MRHIRLFESFDSPDIIDRVDDIAGFITDTKTSDVEFLWCLPNFEPKKLMYEEEYKKLAQDKRKEYIKSYFFKFRGLSHFFPVEDKIRNRAKYYGLKFFILVRRNLPNYCVCFFFTNEDWKKLDLDSVIRNVRNSENNSIGYNFEDILFEEDIMIEKDEFNIIYEDNEIIALKPKTYRAAIRYSADTRWKSLLKKNSDWLNKYLKRGSYYGGTNWYVNKTVKQEVDSWWRKLLKLPPKQSKIKLKEFFTDFPRYLFYIVIFKNMPVGDDMSKLYLLYDVSRSEYGELSHSDNDDWGKMLDAAHNQLKIENAAGRLVTLRDIHKKHHLLFNRAFREIEWDSSEEKEKMYDLLGFWSDKGGDYKDDALVFLRSQKHPDRLQVVKSSNITRNKDSIEWTRSGFYDDPNFDYWNQDSEKSKEKEAPNNGKGYKYYYTSMENSYNDMLKALKDNDEFKL
jgi:hypothetical protein